jgi:hypothetical protein
MGAVTARFINGQIVPDGPVDWPEGCRLVVEPAGDANGAAEDTPEAIARRLTLMDQIEPLVRTAEEEAEWEAARKAEKEYEKATFNESAERLRRMWE